MNEQLVELGLIDGRHAILPKCAEKIHSVSERYQRRIVFTKHFPFVHISKNLYTVMRFRTIYEYGNSNRDPKYKVNCTMRQLYELFGESIVPFEVALIEGDLNK